MSLEAFYPHDVRNALLAAEQASNAALQAASSEGDPFAEGYRAGYRAALVTIALVFGLPPRLDAGAQGGDVWELTLLVRGRALKSSCFFSGAVKPSPDLHPADLVAL